MQKTEQTTRVKAICAYLGGIGHHVTTVQGYEILARAHGLKNKHVLASTSKSTAAADDHTKESRTMNFGSATVPVLGLGAVPLDVQTLQQNQGQVDIVVPAELGLLGDIEVLNDHVSRLITGQACGLEGIGYQSAPENPYGPDYVALRVTASAVLDYLAPGQEENEFYEGLQELARRLKGNVEVEAIHADGTQQRLILWRMHAQPIDILRRYARQHGANIDTVRRHDDDELLFEAKTLDEPELIVGCRLSTLRYAQRIADDRWHVADFGGKPYVVLRVPA